MSLFGKKPLSLDGGFIFFLRYTHLYTQEYKSLYSSVYYYTQYKTWRLNKNGMVYHKFDFERGATEGERQSAINVLQRIKQSKGVD